MCSSHTCAIVCNSPTHSLIPLIRPHCCPLWVRLRPFWYHLPLTRRSSTLRGNYSVPIRLCTHRNTYASARALSCRKVLQVRACRMKGSEGETYGGDSSTKTRVAELIPESNVQREEDGERRGVVSRKRKGWGSDLISAIPLLSPSPSPPTPNPPILCHSPVLFRAARSSLVILFESRCNFSRCGMSVPIFRRLSLSTVFRSR